MAYSTILVPIDGSATANRGLQEAIRLARTTGARLSILNVIDARLLVTQVSEHASPKALLAAWTADGQRLVDEATATAREQGVTAEGAVHYDPGLRICDQILGEQECVGAQLIVMGTHGRSGLRRVALGSEAELVLRASAVPVLLVRTSD